MSEQQQAPMFSVAGQYIKDLSFEVPHAPAIFGELNQGEPEIPVNIDLRAEKLGDDVFEVTLHIKVESKLNGKPVFIAEVAYAGVFTVRVPEEHVQPVLMIECPRLLFPFARNIVADVTRDGGFPPLVLQPVDFVALYQARLQQQKQAAGNA